MASVLERILNLSLLVDVLLSVCLADRPVLRPLRIILSLSPLPLRISLKLGIG